jgi:hypothetical protein
MKALDQCSNAACGIVLFVDDNALLMVLMVACGELC